MAQKLTKEQWISDLQKLAIKWQPYVANEDGSKPRPMSVEEIRDYFNFEDFEHYYDEGQTPQETLNAEIEDWKNNA